MPRPLAVATFNANSIRSRVGIVVGWLREHGPDVLCLQETKTEDKTFPAEAFREAGYHVVFHGQKSYNGVAIASREEPTRVVRGFGDGGEPEPDARLIRAVVAGVTVVSAYVPQGEGRDSPKFAYKLAWLDRLRRLLQAGFSPAESLVVCGDLNIAPTDLDVHDPVRLRGHVCFCDEVQEHFRGLLSWGLVDVFRKHHPEPGQYTFFDYRVRGALERGLGWRVDHVLATAPLAQSSTGAAIDLEPRRADKPSDHTFLAVTFGRPGGR